MDIQHVHSTWKPLLLWSWYSPCDARRKIYSSRPPTNQRRRYVRVCRRLKTNSSQNNAVNTRTSTRGVSRASHEALRFPKRPAASAASPREASDRAHSRETDTYLAVFARHTTPATHAMSVMCGTQMGHRPETSTRNRAQALVSTRLPLPAHRFQVQAHSLLDTVGGGYETGAQP